MANGYYRQCQICNRRWESRDNFLADDEIYLIGYQSNFVQIDKGLFLFNHSCEATLAVPVNELADLYDGPIYQENKTGSDECPAYCLYVSEFRSCPAKCNCAYVRDIIQLLTRPTFASN